MSRASALFQLQTIDLELDSLRARLRAIESELGEDAALRQAQQDLLDAQAQVHVTRVAVQNLELESQSLNAKIAEVNDRTYGGHVVNPKELRDLERDLESLKRRRSALEEQQFDALIAAEAAEAQHQSVLRAVADLEAAAARAHGGLLEERARLQASVARIETGREAAVNSVPPADLALYDRLRPEKRGRPVSRLEDGTCVSCGVAPSSSRAQLARQGNELVQCGNCGRILCGD
jgi:predicted  nucleic acid-binding Zn-ribbon protein